MHEICAKKKRKKKRRDNEGISLVKYVKVLKPLMRLEYKNNPENLQLLYIKKKKLYSKLFIFSK